MNWITKIIKAGEKIKTAIRERATKEDIAKSDWTSCCKGPILKKELDDNVKSDDKIKDLFQSLKDINAKLWVIEDDKRQCEKVKDFGEKFIKLSRDVHFFNDDRAKIKLEINNYTGSAIKEIKEYTSY